MRSKQIAVFSISLFALLFGCSTAEMGNRSPADVGGAEPSSEIVDTCMGAASRQFYWCQKIPIGSDFRAACAGVVGSESHYCGGIKDFNLKSACLGGALEQGSYCDEIEDSNLKSICMAGVLRDSSQCDKIPR